MRNIKKRIFIFLIIMGPGIITASVDNDAGGIAVYSVCGAHFGYNFLWTLFPIMLSLIVVQEMCARMGVVTGKGLSELIRESYGVKITFLIMALLLLANISNIMAEFSGIAESLEIFGISKYISVTFSIIILWLLVIRGTYKGLEKIFLVACLFYIAYPISAILAKPNLSQAFKETVSFDFKFEKVYISMFIALIGTTIAPWMQFYIQSSIVEKGVKVKDYKYTFLDVTLGSIVTVIVAFSIIVACSATLYKYGIRIEDAKDAAIALKPLAGKYCSYLFSFGLLNASLFSAIIIPLSTSYFICEAMGWESGVNKNLKEAPVFFFLYIGMIVLGAIPVLLPNLSLLSIMITSQVVNGILLPIILLAILFLINNKRIMGNYVNSPISNIISWATAIILIISSFLLITNI